jgi:hypothetical protein
MRLLDAVLSRPVASQAAAGTGEPARRPGPLELRAAEVCAVFKAPAEALRLLDDDPAVGTALDRFLAAGHLPEARRMLAHAMERRDAVWWAYLCAMEAARHKPFTPEQETGFDRVLAWLVNPTDGGRRACKDAIRFCGTTSIPGILCLAVWLSGGSVSPYPKRHIEPRPHVCGKLSAAVVYLSSVRFDPGRWRDHLRHFIHTGLAIARGECTIPAAPPVACP